MTGRIAIFTGSGQYFGEKIAFSLAADLSVGAARPDREQD